MFREEEAIKLDGLSVSQLKEMRDKAEKHTFQAEVDRMMKLIINSLYKNKEVSCKSRLQRVQLKLRRGHVRLRSRSEVRCNSSAERSCLQLAGVARTPREPSSSG